MMTTTSVETIAPITRPEAELIAANEYVRLVDQLRSLDADHWSKPTDCTLWDVRAMAGHSVGMMSDFTSLSSSLAPRRPAPGQRAGGRRRQGCFAACR